MNDQKNSLVKATMASGALLGLGLILFSVVTYSLNLTLKPGISYISYAIILIGIILGTKHYRDNNLDGTISYSQALGTGTLIALFAGVISGFYSYIFITFVEPDYFDKIIEQSVIFYQEKGYSDEEIDTIISMSNMMRTPIVFTLSSVFGSTLVGFIISLITSIFLKKVGSGFDAAMKDINENENENN